MTDGKPNYTPVHKPPVWLSSVDVMAAIRKLAETGSDKAVCWDMVCALNKLSEATAPVQASPPSESGGRGYERAFREGLETGYQCGMAGERPAANAWECSDAIHETDQVDRCATLE